VPTLTQRLRRAIARRVVPGAVASATTQPPHITVTASDGTSFPIIDEGAGRPILLLHGGSGTAANVVGVAAALTGRFRVLRLDRRTYRADPLPARPADLMAGEVDDVLAVAAAVDRPLLLVGHSSGAVVALQCALARPDRFAGMLLYEPPLAVDEPLGGEALLRAKAALDRGDPDEAMAIHMRDIVHLPRGLVFAFRHIPPLRDRLRLMTAGQIADDEALESLGVGLDRYAGIDVPTLLLGGDRSPRHLRDRLDALASVLPRLDSVVIMAGQGHSATMRAPHVVAGAIADFADRVMPV
jgi:pimeloyl-ACP methyl ester carboxylesterase